MPRRKYADELSVDELRNLLIEKRRTTRQDRIEYFRRTGRVVVVAPEATPMGPDELSLVEAESLANVPDLAGEFADDPPSAAPRRKTLDRVLLSVEILAILGFLFVVYSGFDLLRTLNRESTALQVQPTLTPTPIISAVVLPSGHKPPKDGLVLANDAEIPEHLRPLVQSMPVLPTPTAGPEHAVRIQIPAIGVDAPVVQGDSLDQLKKGVGQTLGTTNPGQNGNMVLSAHNDVYGEIFRNLDQLKPGDTITVFTSQRLYSYVVTETLIVLPTQVEVMAPTPDSTLTLISCYPYLVDNKRIVVKARFQKNS